MIKIKQKIMELENKINLLQKNLDMALEVFASMQKDNETAKSSPALTYKEVLDEWLNGKSV